MVSPLLPLDVSAGDWAAAPLVSRDGGRGVVWLDGEQDIATAPVLAATLAEVRNLLLGVSGT